MVRIWELEGGGAEKTKIRPERKKHVADWLPGPTCAGWFPDPTCLKPGQAGPDDLKTGCARESGDRVCPSWTWLLTWETLFYFLGVAEAPTRAHQRRGSKAYGALKPPSELTDDEVQKQRAPGRTATRC